MKLRPTFFLKITTLIIALIMLGCLAFFVPHLVDRATEVNPAYAYLKIPVLIGLSLTAIPFYFALLQALKLIQLIEINQAFSKQSIKALDNIKKAAIVILGLYIIGLILLLIINALHLGIAIMGLVIIFVTVVIIFFTSVLLELLTHALKIKIENDLTV
ncbi:DUF2975 domain-containing protein [Amphibacillus sp. Q70]|uniref:DUF2975 domain-containing protein n=1 Tax=Amphibacillus sp. Q70 TaxID=3453416 RepID=UPI003F841FA0